MLLYCPECNQPIRTTVRNIHICANHSPLLYFNRDGVAVPGIPERPAFDPTRIVGDADALYQHAQNAAQQMQAILMEDMAREYSE